jgi:hypothetical protein
MADTTDQISVIPEWNKDKASVYMDLAKMAQDSFFNRRVYEWKIAFGLWAGIGALTYFVISNKDKLAGFDPHSLGWIYLCFAAVWFVFWLIPLRRAFEGDKLFKHYYMWRAEGTPEVMAKAKSHQQRVTAWEVISPWGGLALWTYGQFFVTVLFLVSSYLLISHVVSKTASVSVVAPPPPLVPPSAVPASESTPRLHAARPEPRN